MDSSSASRQTPMSILHALATSAAPLIEDPRAPLAERLRALIIKAEATAGAANLAPPQPPLQTARTAEAPNHGRHFPKSTSEPGVSAGAISGTTSSDWGSHVHNVECDTSGRLTAGIGGLFKSFPSFPGATLNASPSAAAISNQDVLINGSGSSCAFPQKPPPVTVPGSDAAKPTGSGMSEPALEGEEETPTSGVENPGKLEFADFVDFGGKGDAGDDLNDLFDFFDSLVGGGASGRGSGSGSEQQRESKKLLGRNNSSSNDRSSKHMEVSEGHEPFGSKSRAGRKFRSMEGLEAGTNTEYILVPADDGYNWRKYGQKMVKGCLHPRLYFRCTFPGCPVRKTEERADDGEVLERIYRGLHNHPPPGLPAKEIQEEEWETRSEQQQQQQQQQQELDASPPAADANSPKLSLLSSSSIPLLQAESTSIRQGIPISNPIGNQTDNPTGNQTCNTATDRHGSQERLWGKRLFLHHSRLSAPANLQISAVDLTSPDPGSEGPTGSSGGSSVSGERKRKALPGVGLSAGDLSADGMDEDVTSGAACNAAVTSNNAATLNRAATNAAAYDEAAYNEVAGATDKKPRRSAETVLVCAQQVIEEPKLVVELRSNMELLDDGYRWRKYGQKVVRGNPNPRSYYKCTHAGCTVRKHMERAVTDPCVVVTSYEGRHCHAMPGPVFSPPPAERNSPVAAGGDSGTLSTAAGSRNDNPGMCSFRLPGEAVAVNGVGHWVLH
ncbi:unnamed protein product [Closterium sp. NIES-65]|nr:unnamed protein product [Closterium sp. NIES-65]